MHENAEKTPQKILVADDEAHILHVVTLKLKQAGYEIITAMDGEEALDALAQKGEFEDTPRPDLILLDINLPKINGLEVLAKIKGDERLRRIPDIVVTMSEGEEDMVKAYDSGAASFMTKPVDSKDFERLIQTV